MRPLWSTACLDWRERIVNRESLVPFDPLFPEEAESGLAIFRALRMLDVAGQPTVEEASLPFFFDLPRALFGSYDGRRQLIREFFFGIAKKNGKSTLAGLLMTAALIRNWRHSGEYYILAPSKEIADNSFFPARDAIRADASLSALLHIAENQRTITHRENKAFLKVVAADTEAVGGKKTIGLFIDELWQFGSRANAGAMIREASGGLAARPEGFIVYATTQGDKAPSGVFEQKLKEFRGIRDGKIADPKKLAIIYEFPEDMIKSGAYREPENWYIPNPNLGKSVDEEFILDKAAEAERAGKGEVINFEAKYLNVQVGMAMRADSWAGALVWDRGIDEALRSLDALLEACEVCTVGVDGGGLDDLLGVAVLGREKGTKHHLAWAHALISDIGIERRRANIDVYDQFEADGDLTKFAYTRPVAGNQNPEAGSQNCQPSPRVGEGAPTGRKGGAPVTALTPQIALARQLAELPVNIRFVVELVKRIKDKGKLAQVGVDAAGIGAIVDALALIGVTQDADKLDAVRQGIALMGAIKTIEIKLADYSFRHGGTRMMAWCVQNLRVIPTRTAMMVARDEAGFGKVDPLMALFNAEHLMSLNPASSSVYETRGLLRA